MKNKTDLLCCLTMALLTPTVMAQTGRSLSSVSPGLAAGGSPDLPVTLFYSSGSSFGTPSVTALWNGLPRPTKLSSGQLVMVLSAADLAAPGLNEITIFDNQTGAMWPGGWKFPVYVPLSANDLVYDSQRKLLYASVPSTGGPKGNNVVAVNPDTGDISASVFVGSEPDRMALTDDFQWLYVFNDGADSVVRIALDSFRADPAFNTGGTSVSGLNTTPIVSALPGLPNSFLVGQNSTFKIFDRGIVRGKSASGYGTVAWTSPTTFVNTFPQLFRSALPGYRLRVPRPGRTEDMCRTSR
jgi:hypothetical protein